MFEVWGVVAPGIWMAEGNLKENEETRNKLILIQRRHEYLRANNYILLKMKLYRTHEVMTSVAVRMQIQSHHATSLSSQSKTGSIVDHLSHCLGNG